MSEMNVVGMTLEGFFLSDYVSMRERVKKLENEVKRLTPSGYGCIDEHETCDAVKVVVQQAYDISSMVKQGMDVEQLKKTYVMSDEELRQWASCYYKTSSYGRSRPIEVLRHTYQYTLTFSETRWCHTYVTDGKDGSELVDIDSMEENMVDNLGYWCRAKYLDALMDSALSTLRDTIKRVIATYEQDKS